MKNIMNVFWLLFVVITLLSSCKEDEIVPLENNTNPPGKVTNVSVVSGPGNGTISYILPDDKDLLYVKAVYSLATGQVMEVKSSYYSNSLVVAGFADLEEHEVKIYAVNRSEVASEPVTVKFRPLENPVWGVFRSLNVIPDFGGLKFTALNETKADLSIELMREVNGKYVPTNKNIYTKAVEVSQAIRGFDTVSQKFAITIRDRWLNYTDTLYTTLKPLYETSLAKSRYREILLPTDVGQEYSGTGLSKMWDNDIINWPNISMTKPGVLVPQWVTFDLGVAANLSRIVIWGYPEYLNAGRTYYYGGILKDFEVWATDNPPSDGSFTNWDKVGTFTTTKPSGSGYGVQTNEDYNYAYAGISYSFDISTKKYRYLRIKSIKNWQGTTFMSIAELLVYGDPR